VLRVSASTRSAPPGPCPSTSGESGTRAGEAGPVRGWGVWRLTTPTGASLTGQRDKTSNAMLKGG